MEILFDRCAGLDVHKETVVAGARRPGPDGRVDARRRTFTTMTAGLLALGEWPAAEGVRHVAMESTGEYWKPVWDLLGGQFELMPVNPGHLHRAPGRKTDCKGAEWLAELLQHGLSAPGFVPPPPVRGRRELTRHRAPLVRQKAAVADRIQEVLESADIKRAAVATAVLGASGRAILVRLIAGETDPGRLAGEARGVPRKEPDPLGRALQGRVTEHHRSRLQLLPDQVGPLEGLIARLDDRAAAVMAAAGPGEEPGGAAPFAAAARLATIPGVGARSAEVIVAEVGTDMTRFPTAGHLASWAGMGPGNDRSGGERRSGKATEGSQWLRAVLVQVAWAASRTKRTLLGASYRKAAKRLGRKEALVAPGHKILRIAYVMLKAGTDYVERLQPGQAA